MRKRVWSRIDGCDAIAGRSEGEAESALTCPYVGDFRAGRYARQRLEGERHFRDALVDVTNRRFAHVVLNEHRWVEPNAFLGSETTVAVRIVQKVCYFSVHLLNRSGRQLIRATQLRNLFHH